jgi:ribonuclease HII
LPPDFSFEESVIGIVCGVDEVGRGPLAGPVVAAAVVLPRALPDLLRDHLDDSKKIPLRRRLELAAAIEHCAQFALGSASVAEIDQLNILQASLLAMRRAVDQIRCDHALVDGNRPPALACKVTCIVKGDSRSFSIAAASIVAKVARDREMTQLAERFPGYGWDRNAGYGTAEHLAALRRLGATPQHRRSFAPVAQLIQSR